MAIIKGNQKALTVYRERKAKALAATAASRKAESRAKAASNQAEPK